VFPNEAIKEFGSPTLQFSRNVLFKSNEENDVFEYATVKFYILYTMNMQKETKPYHTVAAMKPDRSVQKTVKKQQKR
jgi:hypothetical protein